MPRVLGLGRYAVSICIAALLVAACTGSDAEHTGSTQTGQEPDSLISLKVGYLPIVECAHLYVGVNKQFFEEEGLAIELQPMRGGAIILPAVQQGDLHIGFTNVLSLLLTDSQVALSSPRRLVSLVGGTYERPNYSNHALLVRRNSGLQVKDLGRPDTKIALNTSRNIEELMLHRFLNKNGINSSRLHIVEIAFPEMLPALERGDADVVSVVEPFIEPALRSGKFSLLARQYLEVAPDTVVATYAVTQQWLEDNRGTARRFTRAFSKADQFLRSNDAEARAIIGSFTRIKDDDLSVIGMPAFEPTVNEDRLRELVNEGLRFKILSKAPSLEGLIYREN